MILMDTYDVKADVHSYWISESLASAERALVSFIIDDKSSLIKQFPDDFSIIHVADFDDDHIDSVYRVLGTVKEVTANGVS